MKSVPLFYAAADEKAEFQKIETPLRVSVPNPSVDGLAVERVLFGIHFVLQMYHLDSRRRRFVALVSQPAARTVERLLQVVGREHAEGDGHVPLQLQLHHALRHALADEIEMARISLNDASEYDHGVHVGVFREKLGPQRQFERPRNILDLDVVFGASGACLLYTSPSPRD